MSALTIRCLDDCRRYFASLSESIGWVGKTHLLCRGIERYIPNCFVIPTTPYGRQLCAAARVSSYSLAELEGNRVDGPVSLIAFEVTAELRELAARRSWRMLGPDPDFVGKASDKTALPRILDEAQVPAARSRVIAHANAAEADAIWHSLSSDRLVIQEVQNNLTGRGTYLAESSSELGAILAAMNSRALKVTEFVEGASVTVSGCVATRRTYTSCISRQLVGIPALTDWWAAHCGNELLRGNEITEATARLIQSINVQIGDVLRRRGFWGQFGLDLIVTPAGIPYVVEINARIQGVSSLVHAAEIEHGLAPLQAIHILEGLKSPVEIAADGGAILTSDFNYSQIVIEHIGKTGIVHRGLDAGVYRLDESGFEAGEPQMDLIALRNADELLITPFFSMGQTVRRGDRLAVIQRRGRMVDVTGRLRPEISVFVAGIRRFLAL